MLPRTGGVEVIWSGGEDRVTWPGILVPFLLPATGSAKNVISFCQCHEYGNTRASALCCIRHRTHKYFCCSNLWSWDSPAYRVNAAAKSRYLRIIPRRGFGSLDRGTRTSLHTPHMCGSCCQLGIHHCGKICSGGIIKPDYWSSTQPITSSYTTTLFS